MKGRPVLLERVVVNAVKELRGEHRGRERHRRLGHIGSDAYRKRRRARSHPEAAEAVFSPFFSTKRNGRASA